ncbi:MAG: Transcriptional regulatory protein CreB [bacterium ADurb.Bin374]|nr:MAG: Transcriptional regulatory protein CreB [bacterium ADurb.Bin374]
MLFLSAANEEADKLRGFQVGGMDFITKPFHVEEVLARVNTHIQLARSRRDIADKNRALEALTAELRSQNEALTSALAQIKVLKEFLPICSGCKKIRDDQGEWQDVDTYLSTHSDITFTHGLCPGCFKLYYPDYTYPSGKS